jgi:hypothetical protein
MSEDNFEVKICCMGAGYVGGPTMAVIAKQCPKVGTPASVEPRVLRAFLGKYKYFSICAHCALLS